MAVMPLMPILRFTAVAVSLALGVIGLIMPILPGWIFFGVAALILFPNAGIAQRAMTGIEHRMPRVARILRVLQKR